MSRGLPSGMRTVVVIDRRGDRIVPTTFHATIPWICRICGGPRGETRGKNFHEDGDSFFCHVWDNPCGHVDKYIDVIRESEESETVQPNI